MIKMLRRTGQRRCSSGWDFLYGKNEQVKSNRMEEHALDPMVKAKIDEHLIRPYNPASQAPDKPPRMAINQHEPSSTLTHRERAIFSKIFDTILKRETPPKPKQQEEDFLYSKRARYRRLVQQAKSSDPQDETLSFEPMDRKPPPSLYQVFEHPSPRKAPSQLLDELFACRTNIDILAFADEKVFRPFAAHEDSDAQPMQFSELLGHIMRSLREDFEDAAGAVSIFERAKRQSAESYVAGCSTNVYNEMLTTKWHDYRDVQGIEELVEEMTVNGVAGDARTVDILRTVIGHVEQSTEAWWAKDDRVRVARLGEARRQILNTLRQPQPYDDDL